MPDGGWGGGHTHALTYYNERADHDDALAAALINMPSPLSSPVDHLATMMAASPSPPPPSSAAAASAAATNQWQGLARCRAEEVCETGRMKEPPCRAGAREGPQIGQGGGVRVWTQVTE